MEIMVSQLPVNQLPVLKYTLGVMQVETAFMPVISFGWAPGTLVKREKLSI
jgi:hypothetical protein